MKNPIELQDITIRNSKVVSTLKAYLYRISRYSNFDPAMKIRIFVASDCDFTAFEALDFRMGFTSIDHKISETIKSRYAPIETDISTFHRWVDALY